MIDSNNIKIEVYDRDAYRIKQCTFERPPKNFVDVGANVGWFTKLVDDNFQKCNIFSYELDFENFSNFQKNLNNTNPENKIFASNTAVIGFNSFNKYWKHKSNIGGHKPIFSGSDSYISEQSIDPSMLRTMHNRGTFVDVDVKKTTLWDIIKNNQVDFIDFLKLDCEGSEYEILNHAIGNDYCHKILNLAAEMHGRSFPGYNRLLGSLKNKFDFIEIKNNMLFAKNKLKGEKT